MSVIVTSSFVMGPTQADGRSYVKEMHVDDEGMSYEYEYLNGGLDPQMVLEERAAAVSRILADRESARLAVAGTSVPLTRFQFLDRFTSAERVSIRDAAKTNPIVEDFMEMMKLSGNVSLALARPGLQYLASIDRLTQERANEIGAE